MGSLGERNSVQFGSTSEVVRFISYIRIIENENPSCVTRGCHFGLVLLSGFTSQ